MQPAASISWGTSETFVADSASPVIERLYSAPSSAGVSNPWSVALNGSRPAGSPNRWIGTSG